MDRVIHRIKGFLFLGVISSITILDVPAALSQQFPFAPSSSSYAKYVNKIQWGDGKKRYFFNLSSCGENSGGMAGRTFDCKYGYVKISDPLGSRTCEMVHAYDLSAVVRTTYNNPGWITYLGNIGRCK